MSDAIYHSHEQILMVCLHGVDGGGDFIDKGDDVNTKYTLTGSFTFTVCAILL